MLRSDPYIGMARKYRPQNFDEVAGQFHVTQTLKNAVDTGRISHAYLLICPRGVGKTTIARIIAKCLNCEKGPTSKPCGKCIFCQEISDGRSIDVLEIDGASNRGIDEVRDLREKVKFSPGMSRYKVYIIDEVHMLTTEAFNALLKTLEEPPAHVVFILGTTAPHKLPATILSRCQWFALKRITVQDIIKNLQKISEIEKIKISENSLYAIARRAEGALRDAQIGLDQIISFSGQEVKDDDVNALLGIIRIDFFYAFIKGLIEKDVTSNIKLIGELIESGYELEDFIKGLQEHLRNLIVLKDEDTQTKEIDFSLVDLPPEEVKKQKEESTAFSEEELAWMLDAVSQTQKDLRLFGMRGQERLILELMVIKLIKQPHRTSKLTIESSKQDSKEHKPLIKEFPVTDRKPTVVEHPVKDAESPVVQTSALPESLLSAIPKEEVHDMELSIDEVRKKWTDVIEAMKKEKISLSHFLEECIPREIKNGILSTDFAKEVMFHKDRAETRENRGIIEKILAKVYGRKLKVEFIQKENPVNVQINQPPQQPEEPIVKKMIDLFKARVVERKKIK